MAVPNGNNARNWAIRQLIVYVRHGNGHDEAPTTERASVPNDSLTNSMELKIQSNPSLKGRVFGLNDTTRSTTARLMGPVGVKSASKSCY